MKKLLRTLRQRKNDNDGYAALSEGGNTSKDYTPTIKREAPSNVPTQPEMLPEAASTNLEDTGRRPVPANSLPNQKASVQKPSVVRSEEQVEKQAVKPHSSSTSGNDTIASPVAPKNLLPVTETAQSAAVPELRPFVEEVAYNYNLTKTTIQAPGCHACYSLDARKISSNANDNNWARQEYNVAVGALSRKLTIKHVQLLASSASGCIYCAVICTSLGTLRPGWENEESFVELFLSPNLPVVVRWVNGVASKTEPIWEESYGASFVYKFGLKFAKTPGIIEPDIEFEIYRPEHPKKTSINHRALEPLMSHIGTAHELANHSGAIECLKFISEQATNCLQNHQCGSRMPLLPDRVLWVRADNDEGLRLVEPKNVHAQYIALSYCWGPKQPNTFLTDAASLADRKAGIKATDLPRLFIGIINCARILRIDYLWIDRLCILQGDDKDFGIQAPKMGQYYGNATITFAAASADSEMGDTLIQRDKKWKSHALEMQSDQLGTATLRFRQRPYRLGTEAQGGDYGKVSTRAWIWQERLLAARTIFFTPYALKFECHQHSIWEGYSPHVTSPSWSARLDKMTHLGWLTLVEEFTKREITRSSDRLPAISSVMQRIVNAHGWTPIWGMWTEFLHKSLTWSVSNTGESSGKHPCRVHPKYYAPSWSWASIDGPIDFWHSRSAEDSVEGDPYKISFDIRNVDQDTGVMTVSAHWNFALIRCEISRPYTTPQVVYQYECTTVRLGIQPPEPDLGTETPVMADVALQPIKKNLSLLEDGSIMRVPYGKELPQETWTSKCLCIMLGWRHMRATVLLLGESQRIPGTYERIGLADGWPPGMFTDSVALEFKIS